MCPFGLENFFNNISHITKNKNYFGGKIDIIFKKIKPENLCYVREKTSTNTTNEKTSIIYLYRYKCSSEKL